jgi:hypothetical protein
MARKIPKEAIFTKDPDEVADYRVDWGTFLGTDSDTIVTGTFSADAGITIDSEEMTSTSMDVWLSGGTDKEDYEIANRITTLGSRTWERTILIQVIEK